VFHLVPKLHAFVEENFGGNFILRKAVSCATIIMVIGSTLMSGSYSASGSRATVVSINSHNPSSLLSQGRYIVDHTNLTSNFEHSTFLVTSCLVTDSHLTMKNGVFWDVTPCGSCKNRRFGLT
jgi:hypothetical protein